MFVFGLQQLWNNIYFFSIFIFVCIGFGGMVVYDNVSYINIEGIIVFINDFILFKM